MRRYHDAFANVSDGSLSEALQTINSVLSWAAVDIVVKVSPLVYNQSAVLLAAAAEGQYKRALLAGWMDGWPSPPPPSSRRRLSGAPGSAAGCASPIAVVGFTGPTSFLNGNYVNASVGNVLSCGGQPVLSNSAGGFICVHDGPVSLPYWCAAQSPFCWFS